MSKLKAVLLSAFLLTSTSTFAQEVVDSAFLAELKQLMGQVERKQPNDVKVQYFPAASSVLASPYDKLTNAFPIATLDLSARGIPDKIHLFYLYLSPPDYKPLVDGFLYPLTFKINKDGKYQPMIKESHLVIAENEQKYLVQHRRLYNEVQLQKKQVPYIAFRSEPDWWQSDETPLNSKGEKMIFIAQYDMGEIPGFDDCRTFVFYDKAEKLVKYVVQRD